MTLSDAQAWLVILGGITTLVLTTVASIFAMIRTGRTEVKLDKNTEITEDIKKNTDGKLTEVDRKLTERDKQIDELLARITRQDNARDELATITAQAVAPIVVAAPSPESATEKTIVR